MTSKARIEQMEADIREVANKHLPGHLSDALNERLSLIPKLEEKLKKVKVDVELKQETIGKLERELADLKDQLQTKRRHDYREESLNKREHDLDLTMLQKEVDMQRDRALFCKDVALGLVRNTEYRKAFSGQVPNGTSDGFVDNNNYIQHPQSNVEYIENESKEGAQ